MSNNKARMKKYCQVTPDLFLSIWYTFMKSYTGGYMETAVTIKGQVVIPAKIRHRLGIKKGTKFYVEDRKGEIILRPLNRGILSKDEWYPQGRGACQGIRRNQSRGS